MRGRKLRSEIVVIYTGGMLKLDGGCSWMEKRPGLERLGILFLLKVK
jgi:hypothetical protein